LPDQEFTLLSHASDPGPRARAGAGDHEAARAGESTQMAAQIVSVL
jgi:hypothetical protein